MNYKDITDKQIVDFLTKLKRKPKDDRQDYYDEHLDIARAYLAKIGVDPAYFEMAAVNETIRDVILKYTMGGRETVFIQDGIYVESGVKKVLGLVKSEDIKKGAYSPLINPNLVELIRNLLKNGIEVDAKSEKPKGIIPTKNYFIKGDMLFLDNNTFIATASDKKDKTKIAMVKMNSHGLNCHIKLVDENGIVSYEDERQAFGAKRFEDWIQRFYWYRSEDGYHKSIVKKVEISRLNGKEKKKAILLADDGDPISLDSQSWKYKKTHFVTFFEKYPKYVDWFYKRFKEPFNLLGMIYKEQESEFNVILSSRQEAIENATTEKESEQVEIDSKIRTIIHQINENRIGILRGFQLAAFKESIQKQVAQIISTNTQEDIKSIIQLSVDKAVKGEIEEEDEEETINVGAEEEKFEQSKIAYEEIKNSDYSDEIKVEELLRLLNERHRLIRRISHITPKKSTYDKASDMLKSDIVLLKQASAIIDKAVEEVMGLKLDSMSQENIDFSIPIDNIKDDPNVYEIF